MLARMASLFRSSPIVLGLVRAIPFEAESAPIKPPPALKPETVAAWRKAGATFGYMREDDDYYELSFKRDDFKPNCLDLPAFSIEWQDFVHCSGLPAPEVAFAL